MGYRPHRRPGSPLALAMDGARGVWLYVGRHQPVRPLPVVEALRLRLAQCQQDPPVMLCDPTLVDVWRSAFPDLEILSLTDHAVSKMAEDDQPLTDVLARLDKLPGDLMHLTVPSHWASRAHSTRC